MGLYFDTPDYPEPTPEQVELNNRLADLQEWAIGANIDIANQLMGLGQYELALREANNRTSFSILKATLEDQAKLMSVNLAQLGGSLQQQELASRIGMEGFLSAEARTQTSWEWEMMLQEYNQGLREAYLPLLAGNLGDILTLDNEGYAQRFNLDRFENWMNIVSTKSFEYMSGGAPVNPALEANLQSQRELAMEELARQGLKAGDSGYDSRVSSLMQAQNITRETDRLAREMEFAKLATQGEQALAGLSIEGARMADSMRLAASEGMMNLIYPGRASPMSYSASGVQPLSFQQLSSPGTTQYNFAAGNPAAYYGQAVGAYGNIGQIGNQMASMYNAQTNLQAMAMQPQLSDLGFLGAVAGNIGSAWAGRKR